MKHRMRLSTLCLLLLAGSGALTGHPMGNFSINHYALLMPGPDGVEALYVLDLAELPTAQLMSQRGIAKDTPHAELQRAVEAQAREWVKNLRFTENGKSVPARLNRVDFTLQDGAGGLPVIRVNAHVRVPARGGRFEYEDGNFTERAGWKEVVVEKRGGTSVSHIAPGSPDRSMALTAYPQDPSLAPPQDMKATFEWIAPPAPASSVSRSASPARHETPLQETAKPALTSPAKEQTVNRGPVAPQPEALGTVKRNDYLSRTLSTAKASLPFGVALLCMAAAFGLGALHAVEPGHGKTMVAAYLVGSRGTFGHAAFLGGMVTFTHTASVFLLGAVTLFLSQYLLPETLVKVMGIISGVSIVWIGAFLLWRRAKKLLKLHAHGDGRHHHHEHHHDGHEHAHQHEHTRVHAHVHAHSHPQGHDHHDHSHELDHHHQDHPHTHTHNGHTHRHVPEGDVTLGNLIALGVSGGLVPCPAALVLLLSCISIGRPGFGMLLLLAFSIGLALVLMLIGFVVLFLKNRVAGDHEQSHVGPWATYLPVASAALIFLVGIYMTGVAAGYFPLLRLVG
jgi:ABC-type nickel/cobalt efflux system permease component RcnA